MTPRNALLVAAALATAAATPAALACSSCGCSLSSDWSSQGISPSGEGFRFDFRFDYFNQDQLRSGTGKVDRGGRYRIIDLAHAEHRRHSCRWPIPRIHRGP